MTGRELPVWAQNVRESLVAANIHGQDQLDEIEQDLLDLLSMRLRHRLGNLRPDTDTEKRAGCTWAHTIAHIGRRIADALQTEADKGGQS